MKWNYMQVLYCANVWYLLLYNDNNYIVKLYKFMLINSFTWVKLILSLMLPSGEQTDIKPLLIDYWFDYYYVIILIIIMVI